MHFREQLSRAGGCRTGGEHLGNDGVGGMGLVTGLAEGSRWEACN